MSDAPPQSPLGPESSVRVELGPRSYEVQVVSGQGDAFGPFARAALDSSWAGRACRRALIVTDQHVAPLSRPILSGLEQLGIDVKKVVVPAGEATKSLARASDLYDELLTMRADRHTCIVAVGGGVIGDLAGFVAATYARGLPLLMVPTSLLAQVDSAVGGKVGVNNPRAKNIIGAFHQPIGVWIDTETLGTLPPRELRCGLAEVVKYGIILDADFFATLERDAPAILAGDPAALRRIVAHSCRLKADIVSRDEREETGLRAVLNFGHTFGHAVEVVAGYGGRWLHGEAVAVGMIGGCRLAERIGWIGPDLTARVSALVTAFGLPTQAPDLDPDALLEAMMRDKKNQKGIIRFVLPRALGQVELTESPGEDHVRAVLASVTHG